MIEISGISITDSELEWISKLDTKSKRKVAFSTLCLAKYYNLVNPQNNGWVNKSIKDIFSLSNVNLNKVSQDGLLSGLVDSGFLVASKIIGNLNFRVIHICDGATVMTITDFRNVGNQYLKYCGEKYIECANCGLTIKPTNNSQKYCGNCAKEIKALQDGGYKKA